MALEITPCPSTKAATATQTRDLDPSITTSEVPSNASLPTVAITSASTESSPTLSINCPVTYTAASLNGSTDTVAFVQDFRRPSMDILRDSFEPSIVRLDFRVWWRICILLHDLYHYDGDEQRVPFDRKRKLGISILLNNLFGLPYFEEGQVQLMKSIRLRSSGTNGNKAYLYEKVAEMVERVQNESTINQLIEKFHLARLIPQRKRSCIKFRELTRFLASVFEINLKLLLNDDHVLKRIERYGLEPPPFDLLREPGHPPRDWHGYGPCWREMRKVRERLRIREIKVVTEKRLERLHRDHLASGTGESEPPVA